MVDAWGLNQAEAFKASGDFHATMPQEAHDDAQNYAAKITRFAEGRAHITKALSVEAAAKFPFRSADFVFLDADHSYEGLRADLYAWADVVRNGGWLCGHDYANNAFAFGLEVKRAVDEFAGVMGLSVELGANFTWFIRMPGERKAERLPWDVTVACVKQGTLYGPDYVNILRAMVGRNLHKLHRFVCLTDDPSGLDEGIETIALTENLPGWWSKLELFKPGQFEGRVLYLDLDVVVTGALDRLAETDGIIKDWHVPGYNSSVMSWEAQTHSQAWSMFSREVMSDYRGDQDWLNDTMKLPHFPDEWCISHIGCEQWPPAGAKVVCFHGKLKPHMKPYPWVSLLWAVDGLGEAEFVSGINETRAKIFANARMNLQRGLPLLQHVAPHDKTLCIVGGGPSLTGNLGQVKAHEIRGNEVWALNGAAAFLQGRGIQPTGQVIADARTENAEFVAYLMSGTHYLASTCDAAVFQAAQRFSQYDVTLWTPDFDGMQAVLDDLALDNKLMIGGGPTVGLKAMCIGYAKGYRKFELFGFDSSFAADEGHAYPQPLNDPDKENRIVVWCGGRKFSAAPWMYRQAQAFQAQAKAMAAVGCEITVHGDGLIPHLARAMSQPNDLAA